MAKALCHGWMAGTSQDKPDHVGLLAKRPGRPCVGLDPQPSSGITARRQVRGRVLLPLPLTLTRRDRTLFFTRLRRWRERLCWAHNKLNAAPPAIRIIVLAATVLAIFSVANVIYQLVRKPTEMLF